MTPCTRIPPCPTAPLCAHLWPKVTFNPHGKEDGLGGGGGEEEAAVQEPPSPPIRPCPDPGRLGGYEQHRGGWWRVRRGMGWWSPPVSHPGR